MFEYHESIENKYLWNFTPAEQKRFRKEHSQLQKQMDRYQMQLCELMAQDSPAIFADYGFQPSSKLAIRYTFNRLWSNDSRETELCLSGIDPVASRKSPYVDQIIWALQDNTHCHTVILRGVQSRGKWISRGLDDTDAGRLLDLFEPKKLSELTICHYPLLTEKTYRKIADIVTQPTNRWGHLTLGTISCSSATARRLEKSGKVQFIRRQPKSGWWPFCHQGKER